MSRLPKGTCKIYYRRRTASLNLKCFTGLHYSMLPKVSYQSWGRTGAVTAVVMNSPVSWDITPCSPFKIIRRSKEHIASIFSVEDKPSKKPAWSQVAKRAQFTLVSCLAFLFDTEDGDIPPKRRVHLKWTTWYYYIPPRTHNSYSVRYHCTKTNRQRVLTMVYTTRNYGIFGPCPSSGILETRKHNVSEIGSLSVLRWGWGKTPTQLGPLERASDWG
jgi:hypothetical protein